MSLPNQTQEISPIEEQNVDKELVGLMSSYLSLPNQRQEISPMEGQQQVDNQTVGLVELGNSSHGKRRKQRSGVWKHFEKYRDEDGKDWAKCNLCQKVFDGSSKKGTTHLRNHFNSCQRKSNGSGGEGGDKPAEVGNITNPIAVNKKSGMVEQLNRLDMARKIIREGDVTSLHSLKAADIMDVYNEEKEKLRKHFEKLSCRFCLTIHVTFDGYIWLMVHFIDDDWKLKTKLISVKYRENDQNLVNCFKNELLEWRIDNNITSMVINDKELFEKYVMSSNERENRFSCKGSLLFDSKLIGIISRDDMNKGYEIYHRYTIMWFLHRKIRSVLDYIVETPSKSENFRIAVDKARSMGKEVNVEVIPTKLQLEKMYPEFLFNVEKTMGLLNIGLGLKEAFFELENIDPEFESINLTKEKWDGARLFYECYLELYDDTFLKHRSTFRTANMHFPILCSLYTKSLVLAKCSFKEDFVFMRDDYSEFIQNMDKCWGEYKLILTVVAVLDPRFKMDIVKHWYEKIYGGECEAQLKIFMDYFTIRYDEYAKGTNNFKPCTSRSEGSNSSISYKMLDPSGKPCESSCHLDHVQSPNSELHLYLEDVKFPRIKDFDILKWWQDNTRYFPTLARMARDFLSIQISGIGKDEYNEPWDTICCAGSMKFDSDTIRSAFICSLLWLGDMGLGM